MSITSDKVRAANSLGMLDFPRLSNLLNSDNQPDASGNDTPRILESISDPDTENI